MSQIMKALQESEMNHQAGQPSSVASASLSQQQPKSTGWLFYLFLALILPCGLLVINFVNSNSEWQQLTKQRLAEQQQLAEQKALDSTIAVELPYPDTPSLEPLSEIRQRLGKNNKPKIVEIVVEKEEKPTETELTSLKETSAISANAKESEETKDLASGSHTNDNTVSNDEEFQLDSLDLSGLSPELAKRVEQAFSVESISDSVEQDRAAKAAIKLVDNENQFVGQLPAMNLQTHMYASNKDSRWVKINGRELYEGDWLNNQIRLVSISPRNVVIEYKGKFIEIPALYEWKG
ncbi:hypothetical protein MACH09_24220 [Vibrio sp. MACH09]|uniref:general secretion pathway protein GspB n=1 Tax=Vibrio sp. MACH09 TaxID=3025122 RepID=UPI00278CA22F|nr:general secretion pathway protein GspB [Vibrio sp. MACH09]GLO61914.1 hypothetical protein MACH09_24220 [Vibrio sp. MACH09]